MSSVKVNLDVIDADAHVVENERVWDYLEPSEEKYRPMLTPSPQNPEKQIWVLDGGGALLRVILIRTRIRIG
jgi:hypothetical protein